MALKSFFNFLLQFKDIIFRYENGTPVAPAWAFKAAVHAEWVPGGCKKTCMYHPSGVCFK